MKPKAPARSLLLIRAFLIIAACVWIYPPALHGGWIWDDDLYITKNPWLHDLAGLWKIWFEPGGFADYYPITESVQWIQWQMWHLNPFGYHLTNLVLHIVNALLVWWLFSKFGLRLAWLGGLIFAVHPMQVESVAWVSELKNTLSLPPLLGAMGLYLDYEEKKRPRDYWLAVGLFAIAMLCKLVVVFFPLIILLHAWWKRGRIGRNDLKASAPFFAVALALGLVTVIAGIWGKLFNQLPSDFNPPGGPAGRLVLAGLLVAFYFSKVFLPVDLLPIYPKWTVDVSSPVQYLPWLALGGLICWFWCKRRAWGRHVLLGLGFFLINLAPCPGFIPPSNMGYSWVMDHFLYLPIIGLIGLVVAGLGQLEARLSVPIRFVGIGVVAVVIALMAWGSHAYAEIYRDPETFWRYTLQRNPGAWLANYCLGRIMQASGRLPEAMEQYEKCVSLRPDYSQAYNGLGVGLASLGRMEEARAHFDMALKLNPAYGEAYYNRGHLDWLKGDIDGDLADLDRAVLVSPHAPLPYFNRGVGRQVEGNFDGALSDLYQYCEIVPDDPNADFARLWIWLTRAQQNEQEDADQELSDALNKGWNAAPEAWVSMIAQYLLGRISETELFAAAVSNDPEQDRGQHCEAWYYAGMKRLLAGDKPGAIDCFRKCLATGKTEYFEYIVAEIEIKKLSQPAK